MVNILLNNIINVDLMIRLIYIDINSKKERLFLIKLKIILN